MGQRRHICSLYSEEFPVNIQLTGQVKKCVLYLLLPEEQGEEEFQEVECEYQDPEKLDIPENCFALVFLSRFVINDHKNDKGEPLTTEAFNVSPRYWINAEKIDALLALMTEIFQCGGIGFLSSQEAEGEVIVATTKEGIPVPRTFPAEESDILLSH